MGESVPKLTTGPHPFFDPSEWRRHCPRSKPPPSPRSQQAPQSSHGVDISKSLTGLCGASNLVRGVRLEVQDIDGN